MRNPSPRNVPHTWHRPIGDVDDPWAWLRDRDDPATLAYLEAENALLPTRGSPGTRDARRGAVRRDPLAGAGDRSVGTGAQRRGGTSRAPSRAASYAIHCRGRAPNPPTETVVLDENLEAEGHEFFALGALEVSPDHTCSPGAATATAASATRCGFATSTPDADRDDVLTDTTWGGVAWAADNEHLFYVKPDEQMRPYQVWRHRLGTAAGRRRARVRGPRRAVLRRCRR